MVNKQNGNGNGNDNVAVKTNGNGNGKAKSSGLALAVDRSGKVRAGASDAGITRTEVFDQPVVLKQTFGRGRSFGGLSG
jgi:hypothetical protein